MYVMVRIGIRAAAHDEVCPTDGGETPQSQHTTVTAQELFFAFESSALRSPSAAYDEVCHETASASPSQDSAHLHSCMSPARSHVTRSHVIRSHVTRSHGARSHVARSHVARSRVARSRVARSHVARSHVARCRVTRSHVARSHVARSHVAARSARRRASRRPMAACEYKILYFAIHYLYKGI
jgi:hypothetical protein